MQFWIDIYVFTITWQFIFNTLCLHHCFVKKGSLFLVCSTSQLASCIALPVMVANMVSRQIVKQSMQHKFIDSLPQCGRGKLCPEPVPPTKLIPNADLFKQHFNGYILFIHYSTSLLKIYHSVFHIPQRSKIIYFLMGPGDHPQTMILVGLRALGMGPIIDVCVRWKF